MFLTNNHYPSVMMTMSFITRFNYDTRR